MTTPELEKLLQAWDQGKNHFIIFSSGSTGEPKPVTLTRSMMEWSARMTASFVEPGKEDKIFCCLPMDKVGGMMMAVRARIWGIGLIAAAPSSNPLLEKVEADIISLTPHQLGCILSDSRSSEHLARFSKVLIGGSSIDPGLERKIREFPGQTRFWHTYGMTETCSHIAFREIVAGQNAVRFKPFTGVQVEQSVNNAAIITWPFSELPLQTTDIIESFPDGSFAVLGRLDNLINSGGVKLNPELIERYIQEKLAPKKDFIISSVPDALLGEKLVLVCNAGDQNLFQSVGELGFLKEINPYFVPKQILRIEAIPYNAGGKADRPAIRRIIRNQ